MAQGKKNTGRKRRERERPREGDPTLTWRMKWTEVGRTRRGGDRGGMQGDTFSREIYRSNPQVQLECLQSSLLLLKDQPESLFLTPIQLLDWWRLLECCK